MENLLVLKYGGSSLSTPEKILAIANRLGELHQKGHSLIVVVSAMGKGTDKLIELAHQVAATPARREMDMLISTGERVSMSLMSMALQSKGFPAISFTGSQSGILTTHTYNKARIIDIKPFRIKQALAENKIVIVAGFQGVDPTTKEITTLGRGGSDTTAVTLAAHFQANACKTLKDVDGVFSADPKIYNKARAYKHINYNILKNMCFWGSPILHYRSVALAEKLNTPLFIGNSLNDECGTIVNNEDLTMYEQTQVIAVNSIKQVVHLSLECSESATGYQMLNEFLNRNNLATPQILASAYTDGFLRFMLTDSAEIIGVLLNLVDSSNVVNLLKKDNSIVTMTFNGANDYSLINKTTLLLKKQNIKVEKVLSSHQSLSFVVDQNDLDKTSLAISEAYL